MSRSTIVTKEPVVLEGYQAVMKPSQYGYSLSAIVPQDIIDQLEPDRNQSLEWCLTRVKNAKRAVCKPEPWEEVSKGMYKVKFSWKDETKPPIVDTEGTLVTDENIPVYGGATVKLAFYQKPYIMKDDTYGTSLKLKGIQLVSLQAGAGIDTGDMSAEAAADLFGKTEGFVAAAPNVTPSADDDETVEF